MVEKFNGSSTEDIMALAGSPAGQQLLSLLRQSGGKQLQSAADKAAAGDLAGAKELLTPLLRDPQIRSLLSKLGGQ